MLQRAPAAAPPLSKHSAVACEDPQLPRAAQLQTLSALTEIGVAPDLQQRQPLQPEAVQQAALQPYLAPAGGTAAARRQPLAALLWFCTRSASR